MDPIHAVLLDGLGPVLGLAVERYAEDLEALLVELLVGLLQVGNLTHAGAAPRSPEIDEHVLALEVYKKYKGDRFEIVGVAVWDERADTEKALESLPITWPVIFDAGQLPTDLYGINGIPQIILFGPDGTIVARDLG